MSLYIIVIVFNIILYSKLTTAQWYPSHPVMPYLTVPPTHLQSSPTLSVRAPALPVIVPTPVVSQKFAPTLYPTYPTIPPTVPQSAATPTFPLTTLAPKYPTASTSLQSTPITSVRAPIGIPTPTLAPAPMTLPETRPTPVPMQTIVQTPVPTFAPKCYPPTASAYFLPTSPTNPRVILPASEAPSFTVTPSVPSPTPAQSCSCTMTTKDDSPVSPCPVLQSIKEKIATLLPNLDETVVKEDPGLFLPPLPAELKLPGILDKTPSLPCESCKLKFDEELLNGFLLGLGIL